MATIKLLRADGSRDPRIEDPTNAWLIHPAGRMLLPLAIAWRIPANAISVAGLALGVAGAVAFMHWREGPFALPGFLLCIGWLVADGLDGMVARATRTASAVGRFLDGVCDHIVFLLLYCALAWSVGTLAGCALALAAGIAHAFQSTLYEGERTRFHRRLRGDPGRGRRSTPANKLVGWYDKVAGSLDRMAVPFDRRLADAEDPAAFAEAYGRRAAPPLKLMALLSANMRVVAIYLACLAADPFLFWWFELVPLSAVALAGIVWHRRVESRLAES